MSDVDTFARRWQLIAALSGAAVVVIGAFGGHGLRHLVGPELQQTWRTAVEYQFLHTLALLTLALKNDCFRWRWSMRLWLLGVFLFSGSLYALVLTGQHLVAFVTPLGGLTFIAGWLVLAWVAWSRRGAAPAAK
jgi:uncharacterized membrane protein YgdD (TMEM256/DUF423 family)